MSMRSLPLTLAIAVALVAGAASAAEAALLPPMTAPGRVALDVNGGAVSSQNSGGGAQSSVALPDGGALLFGTEVGSPYKLLVTQIDRAGHQVATFGSGGVATLDFTAQKLQFSQVLRRADGKLLLVMGAPPADNKSLQQLTLVRLNPDAGIDKSFGTNGFAATGVGEGCVNLCTTVAFDAAGRIVFTGTTGHVEPFPAPGDYSSLRWVIGRLTADGAPDASFGTGGTVTMPQPGASGWNVAVLANGRIVAEAQVGLKPGATSMMLTRLLGDGTIDPGYNSGNPIATPIASGFPLLAGPGGEVAIAGLQSTGNTGGHTLLARYSAAGAPETGFGAQGVLDLGNRVNVEQLLPGGGGSVVAVLNSAAATLVVQRFLPNGTADPSLGGASGLTLPTAFAGGISSFLVSKSPRPLPSLRQNSFTGRHLVQRPDGSYFVPGGVSVAEPTGEGEGRSIFRYAVSSLTPLFTQDTTFGGTAATPKVSVSVALQRRTTAYSRHGIRVRLKSSAPGLARVYIRAAGHTVAQSVVPVFGTRTATIPVELTKTGSRTLHHSSRRLHVSVSVSLHDLMTTQRSASAEGALR